MDTLNSIVLLSLIPLVSFGVSNVLQKVVLKKVNSNTLIFYRGIIISVIFFVLLLFNLNSSTFDLTGIILSFVITGIGYFGLYYLNQGLSVGKVGVVLPISSARIVILTVISTLFLSEEVTIIQWILIMITFSGVALSSLNLNDLKNSKLLSFESGIPQGILSAIFWGTAFAFFRYPAGLLGIYLFTFLLEFQTGLMGAIQAMIRKERFLDLDFKDKGLLLNIFLIGILGVFASIAFNTVLASDYASIGNAIVSASPVVSILIGIVWLKERFTLQQGIAMLLMIIGIVGIPLSNIGM